MRPLNWLLRSRNALLALPPPVVPPTWLELIASFDVDDVRNIPMSEFVTELVATYTAIIEWDYREFNATLAAGYAVSVAIYVAKETYIYCEAELRIVATKSYVVYVTEIAPVIASLSSKSRSRGTKIRPKLRLNPPIFSVQEEKAYL
jgi:hypothetical protein